MRSSLLRSLSEALVWIAAASGVVAALDLIAPIAGLTAVYLLAVLAVAIRRGERAALVTAFASVLTMNFFFIEPKHHLTISDSGNVASLCVFLIAAVVVGRLAASERERTRESADRARIAAARERESRLLAAVASLMLEDEGLAALATDEGPHPVEVAPGLRIDITRRPAPADGEVTVPLPLRAAKGWLYTRGGGSWAKAEVERIAEPLARLIDVGLERRRVTERAAAAEASRRADVAKTAVLHAVSHDLRSPLTAIVTATSALRTGAVSETDRIDLLSVLESETARLGRVVDDLLDLSRIEAGAVDPQPDWCDLGDVLARAAAQVLNAHGEHPLELDLSPTLPLVRADSAQLERVLYNLIENAVKFSPRDAPVTVSGRAGGGRVTVLVADAGPGIPTRERTLVFEPFFRGRGSVSGSGLGLAICKGFVEANGGRIQVGGRPGEGTSFTVSFPLVEQPAPAT